VVNPLYYWWHSQRFIHGILNGSTAPLTNGVIAWICSPTNLTATGVTGDPNTTAAWGFQGLYPYAKAVRISSSSGSAVSFSPQLNPDFLSNNVCVLCYLTSATYLHRIGIENLSLTRGTNTGWYYVDIRGMDEPWVKNVQEYDIPNGQYGILYYATYRPEVRLCDISFAESDGSGTYPIFTHFVSNALFEDNIFHNLPNIMVARGFNDSVFAYNTITDLPYQDPGRLS
jgi:hypothetical protein